MAFLEQRLDTRVERGAAGRLTNRGRVKVYTGSGKLNQAFKWSAGLTEWDISFGIKTMAQFESSRALWYVVNFTPYDGFLFRDWSDYIATQENTRLTALTATTWQLQRVYSFAGIEHLRAIKKPAAGPVVYRTRASVTTVASLASVDTTTGIATIPLEVVGDDGGHVSGDTYTWAGTFNVPVTFVTNDFPLELEMTSAGPAVTQSIKVEELRL